MKYHCKLPKERRGFWAQCIAKMAKSKMEQLAKLRCFSFKEFQNSPTI
jgi:hypothetical protein